MPSIHTIGAHFTAAALDYNEYKSKYFPLLFQYQSIDPSNVDDAEEFIRKNPEILSEHATGYLLLRCMDLAMEDPSTSSSEPPQKKMRKVARLEMRLQYIMDFAGSLKQDPRSAVAPFFRRLGDEKVRTGTACSSLLSNSVYATVVVLVPTCFGTMPRTRHIYRLKTRTLRIVIF